MGKKRRTTGVPGPDWFLPEWMATLRLTQADIVRATDWSPATVNNIFHGKTEYYRFIVNQLASVMNIAPFELLMHPDEAMDMRRLRETALRIAADNRRTYDHSPPDAAVPARRNTG